MTLTKNWFLYTFLLLVFSSIISVKALSQPITELRVIGNSATFIFNTIKQYTEGITLSENHTTIRIRFQITGKTAWQIVAWTDYSDIEFEEGVDYIPIENFSVLINTASITPIAPATVTGRTTPFTPSTTPTPLIWGDGAPGVDSVVEFKIYYRISPTGLGALPNGTYYVPLHLRLEEQ